ncbi:hypothetical protein L3Q82_007229 [Scortum barcoo]|uniref:Uncharacterized protein n=1 Tax=Scortum barcoo TaxID=214431 RepID=A0ACB8WSG7_9TELE|nr:hypothetical protein L3Q82_007229 [Scortum barcoo]
MKKMDNTATGNWTPDNKPTSSTVKSSCQPNLKMFLAALSFAYFAKALSGSYMKSTITQLERRFDIPSYLIGIIDGSFEIESSPESTSAGDRPPILPPRGCERESSVSMWTYLFLGNVLRGIGETPVQPLGISYIDDYAQTENAALYIGCVQTISIIGPVFGYLLGSLCAKIYVDIGYVDMETVTITPGDARWVGAWWLGYLIAGAITLMSAVPFWFLPKSLPMPVDKHDNSCTPEQTRFIKDSPTLEHKIRPEEPANLHKMAKDFVPTLKNLLGNPVYMIYLCVTIIQFNSLIGMVTYKPKYIEQHYGQSASKANFLMAVVFYGLVGIINIPAVALGMFSGGVVMKKYKLGIMGAAKFAFGTSLLGYFLSLFFLAMGCENAKVAGITVSYNGREWDPVCGENGITYVSPCLAGCTSSAGSGRNTVFDNCRCVALADTQPGNLTATLGQCPHRDSCDEIFPYFLALSVLSSFIISLGGTPGFVLLVRIVYLGLTLGLRTVSFLLCISGFALLKRHIKREEKYALSNGSAELESLKKEENSSIHCEQFILALDRNPDRETRL